MTECTSWGIISGGAFLFDMDFFLRPPVFCPCLSHNLLMFTTSLAKSIDKLEHIFYNHSVAIFSFKVVATTSSEL
jgi:hypothetical protein